MAVLNASEVDDRLRSLEGWQRRDSEIHKEFKFGDFKQSMDFVSRVAEMAESANHHPDISIKYNQVQMTLSTHSEGGVTEKDIDLASKIDRAK